MTKTEIKLLMAMTGAGENDIATFVELADKWDLDVFEIVDDTTVEGKCPSINALLYEAYRVHLDDTLDTIADIAEDLEDTEDVIFFDRDKLESYVVEIDANGMASSYVSSYDFWDADDAYMLMNKYLDEVLTFLVTEDIVQVEDACKNLKEIYNVQNTDCDEEKAAIEFLQRTYKKINDDSIIECPSDCI